jgi:hypothetical protein
MQRLLNAVSTPQNEIRVEPVVTLDRALILPSRVVVPMIPPTQDQGGTGTCVAHAAYVLYAHHYKTKYGHFPLIGEPEILAFYDLCKIVDHDPDPDRTHGTWLVTALRVMAGSGWPLADGTRGPRITGYGYIGNSYADTKRALAQYNDPILFRVDWDANWMALPPNRVLRAPVGHIIGGHAMGDFGYDDSINLASDADKNSWGKWSTNGNGNCYFRGAYKEAANLESWRVTGIM